jgi:hydrogenase nickel incorporation protein HypA/HybF
MHELSIAQSLIEIVQQEMAKHQVTQLRKITLKYGRLSQVVPDALEFAFEMLAKGTSLEGAVFTMVEVPLRVACRACAIEFCPTDEEMILMTCPACGEEFGHKVLEGKELYIDNIEAD